MRQEQDEPDDTDGIHPRGGPVVFDGGCGIGLEFHPEALMVCQWEVIGGDRGEHSRDVISISSLGTVEGDAPSGELNRMAHSVFAASTSTSEVLIGPEQMPDLLVCLAARSVGRGEEDKPTRAANIVLATLTGLARAMEPRDVERGVEAALRVWKKTRGPFDPSDRDSHIPIEPYASMDWDELVEVMDEATRADDTWKRDLLEQHLVDRVGAKTVITTRLVTGTLSELLKVAGKHLGEDPAWEGIEGKLPKLRGLAADFAVQAVDAAFPWLPDEDIDLSQDEIED